MLMLAGHMDELGLIITYVNKDGFIYFDTIGGHDRSMISGRRVIIQTANGPVKGVTGKRAIHLMDEDDRKKVPEIHEIWIDIGAKSKKEALERVVDRRRRHLRPRIRTDPRQHRHRPRLRQQGRRLRRRRNADPAREGKDETRRQDRVASPPRRRKSACAARTTSAYAVNPHIALAVDVGHATDHPDCDNRKFGETKLGGGPILCRGANINPKVFERLLACAKKAKDSLPARRRSRARPAPMPAPSRWAAAAWPAAWCRIPLRYMHTPSEVVDLEDVERCVKLFVEFAKSIGKDESFNW